MKCSGDKTKLLIVGTRANRKSKLEDKDITIKINIGGEEIKESSSEKLLGVVVNNTLTWKEHIYGDADNLGLLKQLSKRIGILKKIRRFIPDNKFKQIVSGIFSSKLIYCITVWGGIWGLPNEPNEKRRNTSISKESMRKLQVCQNKVLRLLTGKDYKTPTADLLDLCNELSVHQLVAYHSACQVFKVAKSQLPSYHYKRLFMEDNSENIVDFRLAIGKSNFFYQSSKIWSSLPVEMKHAASIPAFKKLCKQWVKVNIAVKP